MARKVNLVGNVYGKWVVVAYHSKGSNGAKKYLCRCECGAEKIITGAELTRGNTKSCRPCSKRKHGECGTKLYMVWGTMVQRCTNPKNKGYVNYGGRGIEICEEWRNSYEKIKDWAIEKGYKEGLLLERNDNNKGYSPKNCTFTDRKTQNNNRRSCRYVEIQGKKMTITQQALRFGVNKNTLRGRLNRGLEGDDLIKRQRRFKLATPGAR